MKGLKSSRRLWIRFTVMMQALENLTQEKRKYREGEHVAA